MSLITRTGKRSRLTMAEMDGNLTYLEQAAQNSAQTLSKNKIKYGFNYTRRKRK